MLAARDWDSLGEDMRSLHWYILDLRTGNLVLKYTRNFCPYGNALGDGGQIQKMCHTDTSRIVSLVTPSIAAVTDTDTLDEVMRLDVSPAIVAVNWADSICWLQDGSMLLVQIIQALLDSQVQCALCFLMLLLEPVLSRLRFPIYWGQKASRLALADPSKPRRISCKSG